jgi:hypothetical protein
MNLNRLISYLHSRKGRMVNISVYGDNARELEAAALLIASECLGPEVRLAVDGDYKIEGNLGISKDPRNRIKKHFAKIIIREIN